MKTNIYWPIYKNIENEINNLMFNIHIDDNQLNVYSSKITDLILRASAELESISKELYKMNGGPQKANIRYDLDALSFLSTLWDLENKLVLLSSYNCFVTDKEIKPFRKDVFRTGTTRMTYSWNNAYQNLKHDRANSLTFGCIRNLFAVSAALYVLNLYFIDDTFDLNKDSQGTTFDTSLGSSIFSIKLHVDNSIAVGEGYQKKTDFGECLFLLRPTESTREDVLAVLKKVNEEIVQRSRNQISAEILANFSEVVDLELVKPQITKLYEKVNMDNMLSVARENQNNITTSINNVRYEVILNKNQY